MLSELPVERPARRSKRELAGMTILAVVALAGWLAGWLSWRELAVLAISQPSTSQVDPSAGWLAGCLGDMSGGPSGAVNRALDHCDGQVRDHD